MQAVVVPASGIKDKRPSSLVVKHMQNEKQQIMLGKTSNIKRNNFILQSPRVSNDIRDGKKGISARG